MTTADGGSVRLSYPEVRAAAAAGELGTGGPETCAALTAALDRDLMSLAGELGGGVAVVALGGYGRGEQCLRSDVDVLVLHRLDDPEPVARTLLYPLWDAGLKVGHAVRTIDEARQAAGEDLASLTSMLSARLVAGDAELFAELTSMLAELLRTRPLAPAMAREERRRRERDPYPTMSADLKEGRGGLRTHQGFWWGRRRAELVGLPVEPVTDEERRAKESLLRVRNALHAVTGRATDRLVGDLREPVARWLKADPYDVAAEIVAALDCGDRLADQRWPDLHVEADPMVGLGRRLFAVVRSRFTAAPQGAEPRDRALALAVRAAGRVSGACFDRTEEAEIAASASVQWTDADRAAFVTLLTAGPRGRSIFLRLEDLGWVARELPEWAPVATAPQLAPFHDHPVGAHLWRSVEEMRRLVEGSGAPRRIAEELGSTEELYLAAFLHDIGKARGGDHSTVGAELAEGFLRRHGWGASTVASVGAAVRHHLLLSETATRRDLADPAVVDEVAGLVGDLRTLDVLYLLTIADLRATGTSAWTTWRATLIERLYHSVREALLAGGARPATPDVDTVLAVDPSLDRRHVEEHVAAMPPGYLETTSPAEVVRHVRSAGDLAAPARLVVEGPDSVLVVGRDRAGFLVAVTRAFTAHGISVRDARLRTRADRIAIDTFHVATDRTGEPVPEERCRRVEEDLVASLAGSTDLAAAVRERVAAYRSKDPRTPEVRVGREDRFARIEVRAPDRIGLLNDIVEALHGEGLDVHLARLDTAGGEARDVFLTLRAGGIPIIVAGELEAVGRRLSDRLGGD